MPQSFDIINEEELKQKLFFSSFVTFGRGGFFLLLEKGLENEKTFCSTMQKESEEISKLSLPFHCPSQSGVSRSQTREQRSDDYEPHAFPNVVPTFCLFHSKYSSPL
jgi:hypothetical protein